MYAIKASWAGQTFALATANDSGGRKSRIRRSKEERKDMIESFVKRYQNLNDGNFPSLNLTHKEVGGSFYTVREIVREIIQENKVLGPAKFTSEEEKDHVANGYSIGSISFEPQVILSMNELDVVPKNQEDGSVELSLGGNGCCTNPQDQHQADEMSEYPNELSLRKSVSETGKQHTSLEPSLNIIGHAFNENQMDNACVENGTRSDDLVEELGEGSLVSMTFEGDIQKELVGACNAKLTLPTKELEVETFPLRPALKEMDGMSGTSSGSENNMGTKHNQIINSIPDVDKFSPLDRSSEVVTVNGADGLKTPASDSSAVFQHAEISDKMIQHEVADLKNTTLAIPDLSLMKEGSLSLDQDHVDKIASHSGLMSKTVEHTEEVDQLQPKSALEGTTYVENSSGGTNSKHGSVGTTIGVTNRNYVRRENSRVTSGASPTLDRIDLESWESKKTYNQETNPLLTLFKAFVHAWVKFWSD